MHNVRVALDKHQALGPHAGEFRDSPDVVSPQVHQHDVLGALLLVGEQIRLEPLVFFLSPPARARAGDRSVLDRAPGDLHQHLGRGAEHGDLAQTQVIHVGRGVDDAQSAIDFERRDAHGHFEPLRKHHLENVTGADIFFAALDDLLVALARHVRAHPQGPSRVAKSRKAEWARQAPLHAVELAERRVVFRLQTTRALLRQDV